MAVWAGNRRVSEKTEGCYEASETLDGKNGIQIQTIVLMKIAYSMSDVNKFMLGSFSYSNYIVFGV